MDTDYSAAKGRKRRKARTKNIHDLNSCYRQGGNLVEDRDHGRDCISQMLLARSRPDVLANALRDMGITEGGDDVPDEE